jgi:hypothetical protein
MPTGIYGILLIFYPGVFSPLTANDVFRLTFLIAVTTFLIPVMSIGTMKLSGTISGFALEDRKERILPFMFTTIFYGITVYMFSSKFAVFEAFTLIIAAITVVIFVITLFTFKMKVSAHSAGIAGAIGILWGLKILDPEAALLIPIVGLIVLCGAVMSARMCLNAHRPVEVYLGALIGFSICFGSVMIFL